MKQKILCNFILFSLGRYAASVTLVRGVITLPNVIWNRRFAIPGVWENAGAQIFQLNNRFFPSSDIMNMSVLKIFQLKSSILSALMTSLDGKNLRAAVCPNPGNSKPSISLTLLPSIIPKGSFRLAACGYKSAADCGKDIYFWRQTVAFLQGDRKFPISALTQPTTDARGKSSNVNEP